MNTHVKRTPNSTQEHHPWRATVRTVAATLAVVVPLVIAAIPIISEQLGPYLPDGWSAWLIGAGAALTALVGTVTRIMALPGAQRLLELAGLGTGGVDS